jgi:hypothetical protein
MALTVHPLVDVGLLNKYLSKARNIVARRPICMGQAQRALFNNPLLADPARYWKADYPYCRSRIFS